MPAPKQPIKPLAQRSSIDVGRNGQAIQQKIAQALKSKPAASAISKAPPSASKAVTSALKDSNAAPKHPNLVSKGSPLTSQVARHAPDAPVVPTAPILPVVPMPPVTSQTAHLPENIALLETSSVPGGVDDGSKRHTVREGQCEVLPDPSQPTGIMANFDLGFDGDLPFFALSAPGKARRSHWVEELAAPALEGDICIVRTHELAGGAHYRLKLGPKTTEFMNALEDMQAVQIQHLARYSVQPFQPTQNDASNESSLESDAEPVASTSNGPLIDLTLEPGSQAGTLHQSFSQQDAIHHFVRLVRKIIPALYEAGVEITDDSLADVRDVISNDWLKRGFMDDKDDEERGIYMMRLEVGVKAEFKAYLRQLEQSPNGRAMAAELTSETPSDLVQTDASNPKQIVSPEPTQMKSAERPSGRRYTADEMEELKVHATPRPKALQAIQFPVQARQSVQSADPGLSKPAPTALPYNKEWLLQAKANDETVTAKEVAMIDNAVAVEQSVKNGDAIPVAKDRSTMAPPPGLTPMNVSAGTTKNSNASVSTTSSKTSRPVVKGLSSSRWATQPTEFAGNFTGV